VLIQLLPFYSLCDPTDAEEHYMHAIVLGSARGYRFVWRIHLPPTKICILLPLFTAFPAVLPAFVRCYSCSLPASSLTLCTPPVFLFLFHPLLFQRHVPGPCIVRHPYLVIPYSVSPVPRGKTFLWTVTRDFEILLLGLALDNRSRGVKV
jgi:hypothetical protein